MDKKNTIFKTNQKYLQTVNMSYSELLRWSKNPASRLASLNRTPIRRNLRLLNKPAREWTYADKKDAMRTISFISRMKNLPKGQAVYKNLSKRDIALRNWAYNLQKKK